VQDQLATVQQLLTTASLEKESKTEEGPSIIPGKEAESAHPVLTQLASRHQTLHIEKEAIEFTTFKLK
jgi:hypothetical protein